MEDYDNVYGSAEDHTIGFVESFSMAANSPAVARAMALTKQALEELNFTVVTFDLEDEMKKFFGPYMAGTAHGSLYKGVVNEMLDAGEASLFGLPKSERPPDEKWEAIMKERYRLTHEFSKKWQEAGISALITPVSPVAPATMKHMGKIGIKYLLKSLGLWSMHGYPAGVMPVTEVQEDE